MGKIINWRMTTKDVGFIRISETPNQQHFTKKQQSLADAVISLIK